jgi:Uma2 family endonuclease
MTVPVPTAPVDDHRLYPIHEEDNEPEWLSHERVVRNLRAGLAALFPDCMVTGNVCIYWEPGNTQRYVAPDVLLVRGHPRAPLPRTYLVWREPPVSFVAEVGSASTRQIDLEEKPQTYSQQVRAQEYFFVDPPDPELPQQAMCLWRLTGAGYQEVQPDATGRLRSEVLAVDFGRDTRGWVRIYVEGVEQPTPEEDRQRREEAETRIGEELLRRHEAEAQAEAETARRQEAEARAAEEAARRQKLERQLAELRARLGE